ncbi:hypothetical protein AB1I62_04000 [Enterococcus sp. AN402]|uniref:hypothetical protein n=1 Tax=Enterococcus sp. AN402 TaxID=3151386 RepID=UPI00345789FE
MNEKERIRTMKNLSEHDRDMLEQDFSSLEEISQWEDNWQKTHPSFAHITIHSAFLTPHTFTAKDGQKYDKAFVSFPQGTKINGVDVSGFSCDVFLSDLMKQKMLNNEPVTLSFKADKPVTIWTGKKGSEQYPYKKFNVKPWDLVKGLKQEIRDFEAQKNQEKAPAKKQTDVSLSSMAKESRSASSSLSNQEKDASSLDEPQK